MKRKVQVWVVYRSGREVQVLILKTRADRGGFWQPVTGSVEAGETSLAGALREAREETGIGRLPRPQALRYSFRYHSRWGNEVTERGYWIDLQGEGRIAPPVRIDPHEHVKSRWVSVSAARHKIRFPSNRKLLDLVAQAIKRKPCFNTKKSPRKNSVSAPASTRSSTRRSVK
ncbi:MAG: NUDIX domain-containing protein [Oligoflexia bacterium]|nr:NUDIX domain-containing protein [Oligoflexia bacterium]